MRIVEGEIFMGVVSLNFWGGGPEWSTGSESVAEREDAAAGIESVELCDEAIANFDEKLVLGIDAESNETADASAVFASSSVLLGGNGIGANSRSKVGQDGAGGAT
jgi:hypothetical protein